MRDGDVVQGVVESLRTTRIRFAQFSSTPVAALEHLNMARRRRNRQAWARQVGYEGTADIAARTKNESPAQQSADPKSFMCRSPRSTLRQPTESRLRRLILGAPTNDGNSNGE